jgi:hypothetical protein
MIRFILSCVTLIIFFSCNSKSTLPKDIIKPEKMQAVLWDYFQADAYTEQFIKKDSTKNYVLENINLQNKVFDIHKVSKEEFYRSYNYYKSNPELMRPLLDSILFKAESKRTSIMNKKYGNHPITQ